MVAPRKLLLMALSSLGLCGCAASWQDLHYAAVNKTRAEYSWYSSTSISDRWNCGSDYAYGYKSGYYDKATGKACTLPAVPPPCYWSTKYQCCDGQKHIADWYRGYQCGVAAAEGSGYPYFHDVPLGPQAPVINKDGCGACYAPTGCLCEDVVMPTITTEASLPEIPHLSSSQTGVASHGSTPPVYQASAVGEQPVASSHPNVFQPNLSAHIGMIGPTGSGELATKVGASRTQAVPRVSTQLVSQTTPVMSKGLIGPVGPTELKTKTENERTLAAEANASAKQPLQR